MNEPISDFPSSSEENLGLLDLIVLLAENIKLLVIGPILVGLLALGHAFTIPPTYTAVVRIMVPQPQQSSAAALAALLSTQGGLAAATSFGFRNPADTYIALLRSRTVAGGLIDRFNLMAAYEKKLRQDAEQALGAKTKMTGGRDGLIVIEVEDEDPKRASDIANAYIEELYKLTASLALTEAQHRRAFFEKQMAKAQEKLREAQLALAQSGIGEDLIKSAPVAMVESVARLKAQVTAQEIRVSTMRGSLTEANPDFQVALRELGSLRAQLNQTERSGTAQGKGGSGAQYLTRIREFKYQETLFDLMTKQYEVARMDEAREGAVVQVVDPAVPPERRTKPKRTLIAVLTALTTGFALILLVLVRESLRRAMRDQETARKLRNLLPGMIRRRLGS